MRIFITGATGFAGSHLVENLIAQGHQLFSLVHKATSHQPLLQHENVTPIVGDLLQQETLETAVAQAKPDVVYHLAGQAYPARSWQQPGLTLAVNSVGTANLLQAVVNQGRPRVLIVTSAEIYGEVQAEDLPISEQTPPAPNHPYGISKWMAGLLVPLYWQRYQLPVVEARPFNHIGPHQALGFVVPDFASQLAAIKLGQRPNTMRVGNLQAMRDFTDVRDVVRAYMLLAEKGQPGESYLICSGKPVKIEAILQKLIELVDVEVAVGTDPKRMRPSDTPCLYGSYAKIQKQTGWQPQIGLEQSLKDILADWAERLLVSDR
ncbi:UDP-glucose 4-epimerase [hydrothermal vent metagenome]|uniref:UDP-glucose 4-epimerase n=1 Tax=hydrothermal vent metagenome TaxID=652676 RepID=A0A3B0VX69_9ZZZZ